MSTPAASARRPRSRVLLACAIALVAAAGCRAAPDEVLAEARQSLTNRDEASFLALVEPGAAEVLRSAAEVQSKSGRVFKVLRDGKPTAALLPKGELADVVETGRRAVVVLKQGKESHQVPMRLVEGQWRIDLLEMDTFYAALQPLE